MALAGVLVDTYGWRAAFWMWIPFGVVVVVLVEPAPRAGARRPGPGLPARRSTASRPTASPGLLPDLHLPGRRARPPAAADRRLGRRPPPAAARSARCGSGSWRSRSRSFFTGALGYWGIEFFKRAFDLNATKAGAFAPVIGAGAVLGLVAGGEVADRLLRRGDVNARVHVTAAASVLASVFLLPAFLTISLRRRLRLPLLREPLPHDAGRPRARRWCPTSSPASCAAGRRRSGRSCERWRRCRRSIVGMLSEATDLSTALAIVSPLYAVGGLVMLLAARSLPRRPRRRGGPGPRVS